MTERQRRVAGPDDLPLFARAPATPDRPSAGPTPSPRRRRAILLATAVIVALLAVTAAPPRPRLLWNASASAPLGLYLVYPFSQARRGDLVVAWPPRSVRALAARRHYLPINVPLLKTVRAVGGDRICARDRTLTVAGQPVARRLSRDPAGRPLPAWQGCAVLRADEFLLLSPEPSAFDGRYFGVSKRADLVGKSVPLWLR